MRRLLLVLATATVMAGISVGAHHSFVAFYFEDQSIMIEGEVQEFRYRNPHSSLLFTAQTPDGRTLTYEAEWANPRRLGNIGINKDTLKPGDFVVVTASPSRQDSDNKVHLKSITRPADDWSFVGQDRRGRRGGGRVRPEGSERRRGARGRGDGRR